MTVSTNNLLIIKYYIIFVVFMNQFKLTLFYCRRTRPGRNSWIFCRQWTSIKSWTVSVPSFTVLSLKMTLVIQNTAR